MGFKKLLTSKKALLLFAASMLLGSQQLMAQAVAQGTITAGTPDSMASSGMWTGVLYYVLLGLVACFCIAILGKILKVYDLTLTMQGKKPINWNSFMAVLCLVFLIVGLYGAYWSLTVQGSMTLPKSASAHGVDIDSMFNLTSALTLIVFVITQVLLFGFLFFYRASDKRKAYFLPHNNTIEKVWTIIPAIVLTVLVVFGFFTWQSVENSTNMKGDINIDVTGHQFAWELRYPGPDGKLGQLDYRLTTGLNKLGIDYKDRNSYDDLQADTLVLPVNKSIRLNIHAQDVIHSVFMPHFRLQQNAVPGLPTYFKFVPTVTTNQMRSETNNPKFEYLLYCNKICGGIHYNMQKVVRVVSESEYQDWIAKQKPYLTDQLKQQLKVAAAKSSAGSLSSNKLALNN
ncbi:cytochrome c oxidase subunit II [Mucilaginibacter gotjawali]|uniref:Cytochrome c oxidase subunit 2 n=1 Tax=Mucilaginibacter gotjawali TaxID=1550579 RepID=A0A839SA80_9SPHI|nr:cytochrome c oxidase subunit II [Mucilaginibacter gotjawali]MBB3054925.1 cytochrome c oxidase subunit 2 [Mucilaginibacter gotjawali]